MSSKKDKSTTKPAGEVFQEKAEEIAGAAAPNINLPVNVEVNSPLPGENSLRARLAAKLLQIYKAMGYIQKKGINKQQGYRFVSEADFAEKMSEACIEAKIAIIPSYSEAIVSFKEVPGQQGTRLLHMATVKGTYKIIDAETGWAEEFDMWGAAQDYGDKAIYKAITGAQKYAIFKVSLCSTGDDPEQDQAPPPKETPKETAPKSSVPRGTSAPQDTQKPAQTAKGNSQEKPSGAPTTSSGAQAPPKTAPAPKETASSGGPEPGPDLKGASLGAIAAVVVPKAAQKPGHVMFARQGYTDPLKIWFWVERLPSGVTLGDLMSFHTNKTEIKLHWSPDATGRWATLTGMELPGMSDMNEPGYLEEAAEQFSG